MCRQWIPWESGPAICVNACSMQLESLELKDSLAYKIIQDHLPLLENHKFKEIAVRTGASFEDVLQAVDFIKHLIPKPGQKYSNQKATYVQPEVQSQRWTMSLSFF